MFHFSFHCQSIELRIDYAAEPVVKTTLEQAKNILVLQLGLVNQFKLTVFKITLSYSCEERIRVSIDKVKERQNLWISWFPYVGETKNSRYVVVCTLHSINVLCFENISDT